MNKTLFTIVSLLAAIALGLAVGRLWQPAGERSDADSVSGERKILYWKAPMDPNYRSDEPGKSPMGMDLVPVYADQVSADDPGVVVIDPRIVNNLGVRTAAVEQGVLSRLVETVGYVTYDEDTVQHVHTRVDGWIETLVIKATGDPVERGQLLFELYSPTLVNAQEEYLAALNGRNALLQKASRERLVALDVTASEISRLDRERSVDQLVRVYADIDGYAAQLGVREGVYITPVTEIMSIAALDQVWVLVEVFERQAAWIQAGQRAEVELDYLPGQRLRGTVDYVYPELDPNTRTLTVRLRFDNKSRILRPNMFARITIFGTETAAVVHVPREALIRGGAVNRVVLALGDGRFRAQPVEVGIESGKRVEIRYGVAAGDRVVTSGQFLLDSESNIDAALARLADNTEGGPPMQVQVAATIRAIDRAASEVTLQHAPVPEWSWPAMTMGFEVADATFLADFKVGQSVHVVIEQHTEGRYVVTGIEAAPEVDHSSPEVTPEDPPANHDNHDMESAQ